MEQSEIDKKVAVLTAAGNASEERAYEILAEAFEEKDSLSFGGQLKSAAQCFRDRDTFIGRANVLEMFASDETLAEESGGEP